MATLQKTIAEKFLASLAAENSLGTTQIEQIRRLLADDKKVKAEDFVKILTAPSDGEVK